ncbi:hypothetical protein DBR36_11295 [Microbacterium sp. HMWF026]|uniref:hypothetical protein n=1 Tax=Microbacterium sp. HMWF026 TaxID=2056861 RepID=UPI000D3A0176|nr:hypothetical protein [Microbacterium sp. HMWF026]PTT17179.1 hypothetical protein DBR36_11295 [Microbacterium sp. HMWF026]
MPPQADVRRCLGTALFAVPGIVLHLLLSLAAALAIQLSGMATAGCGAERACAFTLIDVAANGIHPTLLIIWASTTLVALVRALRSGRNPWPVIGVGFGVSVGVAVVASVMVRAGAGLL